MLDPQKIWNSSTLPTLPAVAVKLLELSRDPETELSDITAVIKTDPAICAKILQSTNSSFFAFSSQVTSIDRAVPLIGMTVVTSLALSFSLASDSVNSGPLKEHYRSYWKQSIIHAVAGETLGKRRGSGLECEYFLAGLMMDIGRLALLKSVSREYYPVIVTAEARQVPLCDVEREFLGFDHGHISTKLMEKWGLPGSLVRSIRLQHASEAEILAEISPNEHDLEAAMVLANAVGDYFLSPACGVALQRIQFVARSYFQMSDSEIESYLTQLRERVDQAGELFNVDMSDIGDPSDLMAQANQQLLELTMRAHAANAQITSQQKKIEEEKLQLQSRNAELQQKVTRDPLTGVHNRAHFDEALAGAIADAQDRCQPISLIFTDIDKFKVLNDTYGHQFGDEVLKTFTRVIARNLRSSDVFARYGGEEFVILVNRPTEIGIEKLAERLREAVAAEVIEHQFVRVPVTASFGAAIAIPGRQSQNCGEAILHQADEATYDSKRNGRNRVTLRCLFTEEERNLLKAINQAKFSRWLVNREILDIPAVSRALLQVIPDPRPLGELATQTGLLNANQTAEILARQASDPTLRFGEVAIAQGFLTAEEMTYLLSWQTEPPQKLITAISASGLFSQPRCEQLFEEYLKSSGIVDKKTLVMI